MQYTVIAGRIGGDAELRQTQGGDSVCNFNVAVDVRDGREKVTNWWRVSLWGKRAAGLSPYLLKGVSVTAVGDMTLGDYNGKPQLNLRASEVTLQGGRGEARTPDGSQGAPADNGGQWDDDGDVPF